jgi:apolipoprotein D and lipocalin family protein
MPFRWSLPLWALALVIALSSSLPSRATEPARSAKPASPALSSLDIQGYMGTWYQVAHYPNRFQDQCVKDSTATYKLLPDGRVEVINRCATDGGLEQVAGVAEPRDSSIVDGRLEPARLRVAFVPWWMRAVSAFWGAYDVVYMSASRDTVVVSEPSQQYLWVLSRKSTIDASRWNEVREFLQRAGFDLARVKRDVHSPSGSSKESS